MKNLTILTSICIAVFLTACDQDKLAQLDEANRQLNQRMGQQDSLLNEFMMDFNVFAENLKMVSADEYAVEASLEEDDLSEDRRDEVFERLYRIDTLLVENQRIIDELNARADEAQGSSKKFKGVVRRLRSQLTEKKEHLAEMQTSLDDLMLTADNLTNRADTLESRRQYLYTTRGQQRGQLEAQAKTLEMQEEQLEHQDKTLHTAYFVVGSTKELEKSQVIDRSGGFLGIGRSAALKDEFAAQAFQPVDIRELSEIPVNTKKVKLLTAHPSSSYTLNSDEKGKTIASIEITDPEAFWQGTRYLVIATD
ncbi:MAG: hypothetical protein AAGI38_15910 [Bacteroidota bacterium]